jgi:hypothetical protein
MPRSKGGWSWSNIFVSAPPQKPRTLANSFFGVTEYRNPEAMKQGNALMSNPLFHPKNGKLQVNGSKVKNFAQSLIGNVVKTGPNGKPQITVPNKNTMKKKTTAFATAMGFPPQNQSLQKNLLGNPIQPGNTDPWKIHVGPSYGAHLSLSRGGKKKRSTRRK